MRSKTSRLFNAATAAVVAAAASTSAAFAWEPTKPVIQFIVPAGTGGGADQMARFVQGVITKNNLMKQPMVVVNKGGGAGAEGFLEVKGAPRLIRTFTRHHVVEPLHHSARNRRTRVLQRHDASRDARA